MKSSVDSAFAPVESVFDCKLLFGPQHHRCRRQRTICKEETTFCCSEPICHMFAAARRRPLIVYCVDLGFRTDVGVVLF